MQSAVGFPQGEEISFPLHPLYSSDANHGYFPEKGKHSADMVVGEQFSISVNLYSSNTNLQSVHTEC